MTLRKVYYQLPPSWRIAARKLYYFPIDLYESISGKRPELVPKRGDIFIGSGDFIEQGWHQLDLLKKYARIEEDHCVLDVGCGIGRTAVALTKFLNEKGSYEGFDVVKKGIAWCNKNIHKKFPNFDFTYVPLRNDLYNNSEMSADRFIFPYKNSEFDIVFLFSVFTHMQLPEIDNYLSEISRVMKSDGACLATFFVYSKDQEEAIASDAQFGFPVGCNGYRLMDETVRSANIAFEMTRLERLVLKKEVKITKIIEGYWKKGVEKSADNSFQDIVIFEK